MTITNPRRGKSGLAAAAAALVFAASAASAASADGKAHVQAFYDLLSNPGSAAHVAAFVEISSPAWESIGDYSDKTKSRDAFIGQMGYFDQLIPDLEWRVEAMHQDGDFITVRSRATGTPVGPLFGVDGQGRGFDILTIDIHELEDGVIVRTHHVEDWAGALRQLSGE